MFLPSDKRRMMTILTIIQWVNKSDFPPMVRFLIKMVNTRWWFWEMHDVTSLVCVTQVSVNLRVVDDISNTSYNIRDTKQYLICLNALEKKSRS